MIDFKPYHQEGFSPWNLVIEFQTRKLVQLVSWPYLENGKIIILGRREIGDSTTMIAFEIKELRSLTWLSKNIESNTDLVQIVLLQFARLPCTESLT